MTSTFQLDLDRSAKVPLTEQIRSGVSAAIDAGILVPGARLPSWRDLAAQLGVARGTVRAAYERLQDAQLIVSSRNGGTRIADRQSLPAPQQSADAQDSAIPDMYRDFSVGPGIFQMGVPGSDTLPTKLLSRLRTRAIRAELSIPAAYPDPRGDQTLRREIAAHLAISRGIKCRPSQIVVTAGYSGALGLVTRALRLTGKTVWLDDPCFPLSREGLKLADLSIVSIPVDEEGMDVDFGLSHAPDAAAAFLTPGQQAPLGPTLSLARRLKLLEWANQNGSWIVEDDYLGELQLRGRAAPALASLDRGGRVIHVGSFSKTVSPTLRLGFLVVPPALAHAFSDVATCLAPAPGPAVQLAIAEFMRDGHYLRHLRRTKRIYAARRDELAECLKHLRLSSRTAGLAMLVELPDGVRDILIARELTAFGLAPTPLSPWYSGSLGRKSGLLLGVATAPAKGMKTSCERLNRVIQTHL